MKLTKVLIALMINLVLVGAYWLCEAVFFKWLYATLPTAMIVGVALVISLIWGAIAKKNWVVLVTPITVLASVAALAVATRLLNGTLF